MNRSCVGPLFGLALICLMGRPVLGWSYKEHIQLTRIAVARLLEDPQTPPGMKQWLRQAIPDLPDRAGEREFLLHGRIGNNPTGLTHMLHWVCMPDVQAQRAPRNSTVQPFNIHERKLHYVDIELFLPKEQIKGYRHDLSGKPEIEMIPRDMTDPRYQQAGMLPLRIEQCYNELVRHIREGKLHTPDAASQEAATATYWAAYLAHYVADNTQPHHATLDYKSQSYFANPRRAPNVHAEMEYRMLDDDKLDFPELRAEYWDLFTAALEGYRDPITTTDPFDASLEVSFISYDALPLIGLAAMHAAGQKGTPEEPRGDITGEFDTAAFMRFRGGFRGEEMSVMELKARQTAWAVQRIQTILRQAWREATGE